MVLTGTGSDGTLGPQKIRERGGLTIAQDPVDAEFASMPQSAISSGVFGRVLPLSERSDQMVRFAHDRAHGAVTGRRWGPRTGRVERDRKELRKTGCPPTA